MKNLSVSLETSASQTAKELNFPKSEILSRLLHSTVSSSNLKISKELHTIIIDPVLLFFWLFFVLINEMHNELLVKIQPSDLQKDCLKHKMTKPNKDILQCL